MILGRMGKAFAWMAMGYLVSGFEAAPAGEPKASADQEESHLSVERVLRLGPGKDNPRNSEGAFMQLKDGRTLFVYAHYTGGGGGADGDTAYLAGRFSSDGGKTWSKEDVVTVPNHAAKNVTCASLLRLKSGDLALFYLVNNSEQDCRPVQRVSKDEGRTWSEPAALMAGPVGYYVMNNDRVIQSSGGRLIAPLGLHNLPGDKTFNEAATLLCYLSDDEGKTWRRSKSELNGRGVNRERIVVQEPGVVELQDGRLMLWARSDQGCQMVSYSSDQGDTWSPLERSEMRSPLSPASIKRIPGTGDLLLVWNDHRNVKADYRGKGYAGLRTPLSVAVSRDGGKTWGPSRTLEDDPGGHYCYTAIAFVGGRVLLSYCAGQRAENGLRVTQVIRLPAQGLYPAAP